MSGGQDARPTRTRFTKLIVWGTFLVRRWSRSTLRFPKNIVIVYLWAIFTYSIFRFRHSINNAAEKGHLRSTLLRHASSTHVCRGNTTFHLQHVHMPGSSVNKVHFLTIRLSITKNLCWVKLPKNGTNNEVNCEWCLCIVLKKKKIKWDSGFPWSNPFALVWLLMITGNQKYLVAQH